MPSFDNTMFEDETHFRVAKHPFYQTKFLTETVTVQAELTVGNTMEVYCSFGTLKFPGVVSWGDWQPLATEALVFSGQYDYWELDIDMGAFTTNYAKFKMVELKDAAVVETWLSEPCNVIAADSSYLQIEFFNLENAFNCYYVNPTLADRLSHCLRIKGNFRKYKPAGETSVYDNQNEVIKTRDEVKRMITLETEPIPAYLAEMLVMALAHDKFFINEVEFVAENKPEYETGGADLASLTCTLTQRDVIGLNAHDVGFDCDAITTNDGMTILQELAASGQKSFPITADHMILTITGERVAGSPVITAGITPGGDDILLGMSLSSTYVVEAALIPTDKASIPGGTLYVTVSGSGATANIYVATFKNRQ